MLCEISIDKKIQGPGHGLSHVEKHEIERPQLGSAKSFIVEREVLGSVKVVTKYSASFSNY